MNEHQVNGRVETENAESEKRKAKSDKRKDETSVNCDLRGDRAVPQKRKYRRMNINDERGEIVGDGCGRPLTMCCPAGCKLQDDVILMLSYPLG